MFRRRCPWMRIPFSSAAAAEGVPAGDSGTFVLTTLRVGGPLVASLTVTPAALGVGDNVAA
eukprot:2938698-Amphidinium_carterae.1